MRFPLLCTFLVIALSFTNAISTIEKREVCSDDRCETSCDGTNCNNCNRNRCCTTVSCNKCVNECSTDCGTYNCRSDCVDRCTRDTSCCSSRSSCSDSCSNDCQEGCYTQRCKNNCQRRCQDDCSENCSNNNRDCTKSNKCETEKCESEEVVRIVESNTPDVLVNNTNNNLVNLTTHINIHNIVHNYNNVSVPVYINTTNINNINLQESQPPAQIITGGGSNRTIIDHEIRPIIIPWQPPPQPIIEPPQPNCCYVMHPRQCYTDQGGEDRCFVRRHRECSEGCTSSVVQIEQVPEQVNRGCQYVRNYPYAYCGNYERRDCGNCYSCNGAYNPRECSQQPDCNPSCRLNMGA